MADNSSGQYIHDNVQGLCTISIRMRGKKVMDRGGQNNRWRGTGLSARSDCANIDIGSMVLEDGENKSGFSTASR